MFRTILAASSVLARNVLDGGTSVLMALALGEQDNPRITVGGYREQEIAEAQRFAGDINAKMLVFDDLPDGFLTCTDEVVHRLPEHIRDVRPQILLSYITHDLGSARAYSDETLVMYHGRIVERVPTGQVIDYPHHEYIQRLLAAVPNSRSRLAP